MKLEMLLGQLKLEMKLFLRDRQAVFWTFFFPIFLILLFGYIFSKPDSIKFVVGLVDEDNSPQSHELRAALQSIPVLKLDQGSREEIHGKLNQSEEGVAIFIPKGYGASLTNGGATLEVLYDPAQVQTQQIVSSILNQIVTGINWKLVRMEPPVRIEQKTIQPLEGERRYIDFLLPGVISMSVMSTCLFSIGMVVVAYREKGKLRRLSVTPLPKSIFIAGQMLNRYFIVLVQAFLLIGIGVAVFDVHMSGRLTDFVAALTVGMLAFIALGFAIASVAKTTETASGIANTLFLPMIFLSGVYFSVDGMPKFLKPLVEFLPLTHLVRAIRSIFNNGLAFTDVLPQMAILTVWTVVLFGVAIKLFKWE
ncbi:MAG: ABC transporter permease [bacterium]